MAPPNKRKRPERGYSQDDGRPSPHRPEQLRMANPPHHHQQQHSPRGGGPGRRQSRNNGRGGSSSVPQSPNVSHAPQNTMSPPVSTFQPNKPAPSIAPPTRRVPESNEYLTPARVSKWTNDARDAVVQAAVLAQREGDILTLSVVFHEIIEAAMDNAMSPDHLGSMVRDIVAAPSGDHVDPVSTFLDTLSSLTTDKGKQALVRNMLVATEIAVSRMRNELENDLLSTLGLVRDTFGRVAVRKATHALYRQSNYNLLREETEGYSKLMTEYFTTVNSEPPSQEVVSETYQRVNALIGAFDLDIGRVLDVTLDVFANLLVKHGKFFVKFLRCSAWWPELRGFDGIEWTEPDVATLPTWALPTSQQWYCSETEKEEQHRQRELRDRKFWQRVGELGERAGIQAYFELGARRITSNNRQPDQTLPAEGAPLSKQQAARKWADEWIAQTGTMPPSGNDIAAQLLGFKLRFYASDARDASDFLPDNLIYLAALLIKIGFISILDLYPHLYPSEEDMTAHKERLLKAKKEKEQKEKGSISNALTMAGALPDEGPHGLPAVTRLRDAASKSESERSTPAKSDDPTEKKSSLPEPADQKYQLLRSLLCIGALPEALFILGRHPWLLDVYPDLLEYILRLGHHSLSKVYEATRPGPADDLPVTAKGSAVRQMSRPSDFIPRRTLRWAKPDMRDAGDGIDYKFYWEDWVDNVPVCQEVDDVIKLCTSLLGLLGPECGQDIMLMTKIIRIGRKSLSDNPSPQNRKRWVDFSTTFIAPALSYTGKNPGVVNEAWSLFKTFDTATRFTMYQQWFSSTKPASIRTVFEKVRNDTNHVLSRVTDKNTKEYGRKLAKISYANPAIVFQLTLRRLINYPNMIGALVECVRYLTLLGYDCLVWTLVNFLLRPEKGNTQEDGMLSAPWLKNIASFIGKACQKNPLMDATPLLQLTAHQLLQPEGDLYMQDVLEQMCSNMGGVGTRSQMSESIILSLCGGNVLRNWTLKTYMKEDRTNVGSSARRLIKSLQDTGLAPQILIAMAQHTEAFVYREDQQDAPDKAVLFSLDRLRLNFLQYVEFLREWMTVEDFDRIFPGPVEMMTDYNVTPPLALTIARASMAHRFNAARKQRQIKSDGDVVMSDGEGDATMNSKPEVNGKTTPSQTQDGEAEASGDVEMKDALETDPVTTNATSAVDLSLRNTTRNFEVQAFAEELKSGVPRLFTDNPCVAFHVTFWSLTLTDIDDAGIKRSYESTITHLRNKLPAPIPANDRRKYPPQKKQDETIEQRQARIDIPKLQAEQPVAIKAASHMRGLIQAEMWQWFENIPMVGAQSDAVHNALLQDCFLARTLMSLEDAQYAAAMLKFMHSSGVPGFRTIKLLDLLFNANKLACLISMFSETEASSFGRFLSVVLRELGRWHENKNDAYAKYAQGPDNTLPGFGRRFDSDRNPVDHLQYDAFCHLLYKWHRALFIAFNSCLDSGDFQQIRNSLSILSALYQIFPKVSTMVTDLETIVKHMSIKDKRDDIKIQAASSLYLFSEHKITKVLEWKFRNIPEPPKPVQPEDTSKDEKSKTPQPQDSSAVKLSATAPTFKSTVESNGVQRNAADKSNDVVQRSTSTPATPAPATQREPVKPAPVSHDLRSHTPLQSEKEAFSNATGLSSQTPSVPSRPEGRNTPQPLGVNRPSHALPNRPDHQPPRNRQPERHGVDRQLDPNPRRYDSRGPPNDYGRLDRPGDVGRLREASPGRHMRPMPSGRTPERVPSMDDHRDWSVREPRGYDDRNMRAPPRDVRGPPLRTPGWEQRDPREPREHRDRSDSRGQSGPPQMEPRRMHSSSSLAQEHAQHRHDGPPLPRTHHSVERGEPGPPRPLLAPTSPATEGPMVNPARAAMINNELDQHDRSSGPPRPDREHRRERDPRPQSPRPQGDRRMDDRPPSGYHGRVDQPREERGPPTHQLSGRDYRDGTAGNTPTGPRGGRNELQQAGTSREMFQPPQPPRRSGYQAQDPNYGRLNAPADSMPPSGPRSDRPQQQSQAPANAPLAGPGGSMSTGVHPSRLENIQRPPPGASPQSSMPNAPSGPRSSGRGQQGPPLQSPANRGPPTGPASNERGPRGNDRRHQLGAINNVLTQNTPASENTIENQPPPPSNPPVRGRGSTRANGAMDNLGGMTSPMLPPAHNSIYNSRPEGSHHRSSRSDHSQSRAEGAPQDDTRSELRSHRDGRRSERSERNRSRSPDRSEKRPDERSTRNGPTDRPPRVEGEERERGSREKRGGDRDGSSRRGREGERSSRGEQHEGSRPHRSSREDGRTSGRDERERRSRGGGAGSNSQGGTGGDDGRKRIRDPQDQGQGHGDAKRRR